MREIQTGDGLLKGIFIPGEYRRVAGGVNTPGVRISGPNFRDPHVCVDIRGNISSCPMFAPPPKQPKSPHQRVWTRLIAPTLKSGSGFGSGGAGPAAAAS